MTSKKDKNKIPRGWKYVPVFSRKGYYRHDGVALNRCQWLKPAIWTVATQAKRSASKKAHGVSSHGPEKTRY